MKLKTLSDIIKAVNRAEEKHPFFAENLYHAVSLATEELGEVARAANDGNLAQVKAEALDTIAVLVRLIYLVDLLTNRGGKDA